MSVEALSWAWQTDVSPPASKLLLLALADAANEDGECWPKIATLATKSGLSTRHVKRLLHELEGSGLIEAAERFLGRQSSNLYRLPLRGDAGVTPRGARGDAGVTRGVTPMSPPIDEPSVEPKAPPTPPHAPAARNGSGVSDEVRRTFNRHLLARKRFYQDRNGKEPLKLPDLTPELARAIRKSLKEHGLEKTMAAGVGIFYSDFHTGKNPEERLHISPALCWRMNGSGDNVERFSDLYFNQAGEEAIGDE